mmetsp:Transcript_105424/g.340034  ORF Transcript_105424/g.340034 Transcript_105424/m.340034 type:complete len:366 (-) Transcript_105424:166-1263(-)
MPDSLTLAQKAARIKEVFKKYDKDGNGSISCQELQAVLKSLGNFKDTEINTVFTHIDKNGDGKVQFNEFVDWITQAGGTDTRAKVAMAPCSGNDIEAVFLNFCGTQRADMDCKSFTKMCKDCGFIDKRLTATETDLIFSRVVTKGKRRITLQQFEAALELVAQKRGLELEQVRETIIESDCPVLQGTKGDAVRLYDDTSTYTGIHARPSAAEQEEEEPVRGRSTAMPSRTRGSSLPPAARSSSQPPAERGARDRVYTYREVFRMFCGPHGDMDGKGFAKLCKDCRFVDGRFTPADADLLFATVASKGLRRINIAQFEEAIYQMAEKKGMDYGSLLEAISDSGGPVINGTRAEDVRLYGAGNKSAR